MNINEKHRYKYKAKTIQPNNPIPGVIYTGDAGNSEWFTGMLLRYENDFSIICDARGVERVVISSTLRSIQVTE